MVILFCGNKMLLLLLSSFISHANRIFFSFVFFSVAYFSFFFGLVWYVAGLMMMQTNLCLCCVYYLRIFLCFFFLSLLCESKNTLSQNIRRYLRSVFVNHTIHFLESRSQSEFFDNIWQDKVKRTKKKIVTQIFTAVTNKRSRIT